MTSEPIVTALVLAGSRRGESDPVARYRQVSAKCLATAGGVPLLVRVLRALTAMPEDRPRSGVARRSADPRPSARAELAGLWPIACAFCAARRASAGPSLRHSSSQGRRCSSPPPTMPCSIRPCSRISLRAPSVQEPMSPFGVAAAATIRASYPDTRRTYLRFRDGGYSGANLFLLRTTAAARAIDFWRRIERDRKAPWRLARAFGPILLVAYLLRLATLAQAMALVSRRMGIRVAAVVMPTAEAAIDVDKPADLDLVESILARRGRRRVQGDDPADRHDQQPAERAQPQAAWAASRPCWRRRPDVEHIRFEPGLDLKEVLAGLAARGCSLLVLNSGDGLVHGILGALMLGRAFETPPPLALLPRGMTNMTAADVGLGGRGPSTLAKLLAIADCRRDRAIPGQAAGAQGRLRSRAAGRAWHVLRCRRHLRRHPSVHRQHPHARTDGQLGQHRHDPDRARRAVWRGGENTGIGGDEIGISVDGAPSRCGPRTLVLATTLDRLVLGTRPFWNTGEAPIHFTSIDHPAAGCHSPCLADPVRRQVSAICPIRRSTARVPIGSSCGSIGRSPSTVSSFARRAAFPVVITGRGDRSLRQAAAVSGTRLSPLEAIVAAELAAPAAAPVAAIADAARAVHGQPVCAVLFYGSCRRDGYRDGLLVDLYLLVDDYAAVHALRCHALAESAGPAQRLLSRDCPRRRQGAGQVRAGEPGPA